SVVLEARLREVGRAPEEEVDLSVAVQVAELDAAGARHRSPVGALDPEEAPPAALGGDVQEDLRRVDDDVRIAVAVEVDEGDAPAVHALEPRDALEERRLLVIASREAGGDDESDGQ